MTAQIIPFPRRKPLELHELPEYWPDGIKGLYLQETRHHPHDEVFAYYDARAKARLRDEAMLAGNE